MFEGGNIWEVDCGQEGRAGSKGWGENKKVGKIVQGKMYIYAVLKPKHEENSKDRMLRGWSFWKALLEGNIETQNIISFELFIPKSGWVSVQTGNQLQESVKLRNVIIPTDTWEDRGNHRKKKRILKEFAGEGRGEKQRKCEFESCEQWNNREESRVQEKCALKAPNLLELAKGKQRKTVERIGEKNEIEVSF